MTRTSVLVAIACLAISRPAVAGPGQKYVSARFTAGTAGTAQGAALDTGVPISDRVMVFATVGNVGSLSSDLRTRIATVSRRVTEGTGLEVSGQGQAPAWYGMAGVRYNLSPRTRIAPYVQAALGIAYVQPKVSFTATGGELLAQNAPNAGQDVTHLVLSMDVWRSPTPITTMMISGGAGALVQLDRHFLLDLGLRISHAASRAELGAQSVSFGLGYRF